ncbi:hypothetical protein, variant [Aphanomyces astaci]|uniref:E3 ubiquitin-protein ligase HACE1 n=1 Tax=Aphanomyces astaci TaxID=112090 RepID=W4GU92_APHAT|nr:hypothetical protein, variant [Aphanomyces astaci]ETV82896.1 hypothetical protein, variant [Aphanomyces astaci]|eukprot:XP_009827567.1 hypothetical protein, variant [Aphanomyces astaci]
MDGIAESNTGSSRGGRQRRRNNRRSGRGGSRQGKGDEEGGGNVAPALVPAESTIPLLPHQRPKSIAAPLTSAVTSLSLETVTTLLVNNPSLVNLVDHKGETALTTVCGLRKVHSAEAHTAIVQALFAHGALLSVKNRQGRAAFTLACCRHHVHLLPFLLQEAVKQEQVNPYETVPALLLATLGGLDNRIMDSDRGRWDAIVQIDPEQCFQTVEFLLEQTKLLQNGVAFVKHACQSLNARGLTPLHLAAGLFQPKTVAYLLDNNGDPHVHEDNALTPVQFLDVCFCQIESFLVDTSASDSHPLSAPNHPRGNTRRGRGKRSHVVSADGTSVQTRALETLLTFARHCGIEPLFMNNGCFSLRCRRLKNAVVAHLGLASILETTCGARETMGDAKLVLLDYVAGLYRAMQKNPDLRAYWDAAIRRPDIATDTASSAIKYPFTDKTLRWLVKGLTEGHPNPRFLSTWAYIIADVLKLYAPGSGGQLNNVEDLTAITTSMARSVKRLMFNLCDADTADDEVEIKLLLSKLEMLMLWLVPYVTSLPDEVDPVHDVLKVVTEPLVELKFLVHLALQTISGEVYAPDRFAATLHVLQLVAQLEACFESDQLPRLVRMFKAQVEKPHAHTWRDSDQSKVPVSLNLVSAAFGLPASFVQWMQPLRTNVNDLIRSEVRLLPEYFQEWTTHASFITTENKLEYIETVAEERPGHFQLTINRQVSPECFLDFVIQQVLCTSIRNLTGEMEIKFLNEPAIGVGPLREFFELVGKHFFNPNLSMSLDPHTDHVVASTSAKSIFSQWLHLARHNISTTLQLPSAKDLKADAKITHSSALWLPIFAFTDASQSLLCLHNHPLSVVCAPTKDDNGVVHTQFDHIVENVELGKVYRCAGRLTGLALRHQAPLGVHLPEAFWKLVRGTDKLTWQDYTSHSPQFQSSLAAVLDHDFGTDDNNDAWELYFESCGAVTVVGTADEDGTTHHYPSTEIELQVGGKSIRVTNDNKARYVQLRAERFFCNQMTHMQAFQKVQRRRSSICWCSHYG